MESNEIKWETDICKCSLTFLTFSVCVRNNGHAEILNFIAFIFLKFLHDLISFFSPRNYMIPDLEFFTIPLSLILDKWQIQWSDPFIDLMDVSIIRQSPVSDLGQKIPSKHDLSCPRLLVSCLGTWVCYFKPPL